MKPGRIDRRLGQHFVDYQSCTLSPGKKKRRRIRNLGWVTELCGVPNDELMENGRPDCPLPGQEPRENESVDVEVRKAVARLRPEEKQFVDLFYFQFRSYKEIARRTGKKVRKLETINNRVREKLKLLLADFVKKRFGVIVPPISDCVICSSPNRAAIDELIRKKRDHQTCSGLISILRREYDLDIRTPQVIIGHRRKHMV